MELWERQGYKRAQECGSKKSLSIAKKNWKKKGYLVKDIPGNKRVGSFRTRVVVIKPKDKRSNKQKWLEDYKNAKSKPNTTGFTSSAKRDPSVKNMEKRRRVSYSAGTWRFQNPKKPKVTKKRKKKSKTLKVNWDELRKLRK